MNVRRDDYQARHGVLAVAMTGIAITFILIGKEPGWPPFLAAIILSITFFITALFGWRDREWLGILTLAVLMLAVFWDPSRPHEITLGVAITILSVLNARFTTGEKGDDDDSPLIPDSLVIGGKKQP